MKVRANGLSIEVDDLGPRDAPPLVLIMGLGMQLTGWPQAFVDLLLARGFRVIRLDNRDVGLSDGFDHAGVPNIPLAALRHVLHLPIRAPYVLRDMAADVVGVLDALDIPRAHVCGASLGGMIAQHVAASVPARVDSLALMMTTSGSRRMPTATKAARRALLSSPSDRRRETLIEHSAGVFEAIGSPGFPIDRVELRRRVADSIARAYRPAGSARQLLAMAADGDRTKVLGRIVAPTLVIHGEADPLIPPANGRELLARIPGSIGDFIGGMGHDLPDELLVRFVDRIVENAARSKRA